MSGGASRAPATLDAAHEHAILAAALDPIITIDSYGVIRSASNSTARIFGWAPAELIGRDVSVLMAEPHRSSHADYLANFRRTGETHILGRTLEVRCARRDGTPFPAELSVSRVEQPGDPLFVGILRDVSERKHLERELARHNEELERLVAERTAELQTSHDQLRVADRLASIGSLAAGLGHDMNNVLLPVRAHLNALRAMRCRSPEGRRLHGAMQKHVASITGSIAYLQQLADGLHFLAMDPELESDARGGGETTDLRQWWSQTGPLLKRAVPRHVEVSASIGAQLPRVAIPAHRLTQAVLNLVVNAGEAIPRPLGTERRDGRVRLRATFSPSTSQVGLSVADNGVGMSQQLQRRAFEMFFTTKPRGLGTGLGLAIVHKVATSVGGSVEVESEPGIGTTMRMLLPVARDPAPRGHVVSACVTLIDERASALVSRLLELGGARLCTQDARADIRVLSSGEGSVALARAWRAANPTGALVVFGQTDRGSGADWVALDSMRVDNPEDFLSVRRTVGMALARASTPR